MNQKQLLLLICTFLISWHAHSKSSSDEITGQFCYLPTESNVSYSSVLELEKSSPSHVLNYGEDKLQFGELWLPKSPDDDYKHPLLVFIHGGCWLNQYDISHTHALSTGLSNAGYAVWSIEYRRTGDLGGGWPGSFEDVKNAINYLPKLSSYPVDLRNVALLGHSAGGHLALLAGAERKTSISAVIGLAAIYDIEDYSLGTNSCQSATAGFMGGTVEDKPSDYDLANPSKTALHSNTILIKGTLDTIVPASQTQSSQHKIVEVQDAGHFDMIHPGTPTFQALLKELASIFK